MADPVGIPDDVGPRWPPAYIAPDDSSHDNEEMSMVPPYVPQFSHGTQDTQFSSSTYQKSRKDGKRKSFKALKRSMTHSVADFFLGDLKDEESLPAAAAIPKEPQDKWRNRSCLLHTNPLIGGQTKAPPQSYDTTDSVFDSASQTGSVKATGQIVDPLHRPGMATRQDSRMSRASRLSKSFNLPSRQWSHVSTASSSKRSVRPIPRKVSRKESVVKMAFDGIKDWMGTGSKSKRKPLMHSRSFAPASVSEGGYDDLDTIKRPSPAVDSVFTPEESVLDDVFFNTPTPTGTILAPFSHPRAQQSSIPAPELPTITERSSHTSDATRSSDASLREPVRPSVSEQRGLDTVDNRVSETDSDREIPVPVTMAPVSIPDEMRPTKSGWRVGTKKPTPVTKSAAMGPDTPDFLDEDMADGPFEAMARIKDTLIDATLDNSNRREIGKGIVGNMLDLSYRRDRLTSEIEAQIEAIDEHRPYFTYWVTFVQVAIYIISVSVYGIAPIGFEETRISGEVRMPNLAIQVESRVEKDNLWIGPTQADLIHLGAKYSPCMRKDMNVEEAIMGDHILESQTACCIRNDGSGCLQMPEDECSDSLSKWYSWRKYPTYSDNRTSGSVCGTDPRKCKNPLSQGAFEWKHDITKWPICLDSANVSDTDPAFEHMSCKVSGRPCCIGIQGECKITTREHCQFLEGFFHEEAFLCSQISCMNEICGMITFLDPEVPDQFYRLWTSFFLHAGLLQLIVTILFQFFIMRDMEKLAGWLRIAIIYIGSGIAGSLASAIFLPYHVEAGPAGSQFGILAMLFVELIQNFYIILHPWRALGKLIAILVFLFILGLLPYIDNYAHLIGFVFGFLLSFALLPYITFNKLDRRGKIIGIVVCLITATGLFAVLVVLFYVSPVYSCPYCHYFNCIPFTPKFCESMEVKIRRNTH